MTPIAVLAMAQAALAFLKEAVPQIRDAVSRGEITAEDQNKLLAEFESLSKKDAGQFQGEHWKESGRTQ